MQTNNFFILKNVKNTETAQLWTAYLRVLHFASPNSAKGAKIK